MGKTIAAGIFLINKKLEVLICHPTNHAWNVWSIPKGRVEKDELHLDAAIRETHEETNIDLLLALTIHPLNEQKYTHGKKTLFPFLVLESQNPMVMFEEFDLKCNSCVPEEEGGFPEMDAYEWTTIAKAKEYLHYTQAEALNEIEELLKNDIRFTRCKA